MNKQTAKLNEYLSDLGVLNVKLHNLHWNVSGRGFHQAHVYIETLYDDFFEKFDVVAERIKMLGDYPLASLKEYLEKSDIKELETKDYSVTNSYKMILEDFQYLKTKAIDIRSIADEVGDFGTVAIMEDHVLGYDKQIWFIESELK